MAKRTTSSEKAKQIFLAVLGVAFAAAIVYQFLLKGPSSAPRRNPQTGANANSAASANASASATPKTRQSGAAAQREALLQALLADTTPLNLRFTSSIAVSHQIGGRGNIFGY